MTKERKFNLGDTVTIEWATHSSYESEYSTGVVKGFYLDNNDKLYYKIFTEGELRDVPSWQVS